MRFLLALFAVVSTASADVIVYKGTARTALDAATQFSKTPRLYLVVDLTAKTSYLAFYFKLNGVKRSSNIAPFDHTRYLSEPISADKRIGTFTYAFDSDFPSGDFGTVMLYLRGKETSLTLSNNGVPSVKAFPKTLVGVLRQAQLVSPLAATFEFNFTLTFDPIHTVAANNLFKNGATTFTDIGAELTALGY